MNEFRLGVETTTAAWLQRRDPRLRVATAVLFALLVVSRDSLPTLALLLMASIALALAAGIRMKPIARRLIALEGFMLVLLLLLPFSVAGTPWFEVAGFSASQEGLHRAAIIILKANTVVLGLLILVGTLEPIVFGHALAQLRVPPKLVHLYLFSLRYIGLIHAEYSRLRLAMRARAFVAGSNRHTWRTVGWLAGMLLVRSLQRSQRIVAAMRCRGFDGRLYILDQPRWRGGDTVWALTVLLAAAGVLLLEHGG